MTAPLPQSPDRFSTLREAGILLPRADQLRLLETEMETFRGRTRVSRRPSRAERLVLSVTAVFTETARILKHPGGAR